MSHTELRGINILLPTYKRAAPDGKLRRFLSSAIETAADPKCLAFTIMVNKGDSETEAFVKDWWHAAEADGMRVSVVLVDYPKPNLGWFYNTLYEFTPFKSDDLAVTLLGDDMIFRTKGWDARVLEELNKVQGLGMVHCRDGIQNGKIAVNFFTSRAWVNATGGRFMVDTPVDFVDVAATEVARKLGREIYLDNVEIEHDHSSLKAEKDWDEGFRRLRAEYGTMEKPEETVKAFVDQAVAAWHVSQAKLAQ